MTATFTAVAPGSACAIPNSSASSPSVSQRRCFTITWRSGPAAPPMLVSPIFIHPSARSSRVGFGEWSTFAPYAPDVIQSALVTHAVKPLEIGSISIWPPIVLAPMSGVTNRTLRALYKPFGFGLTVTEFVSSNALQYKNERTMDMIDQHGVERPVSTQLWGNDPAIMAQAAKLVRECGADIVDINFGCPAPKVTKTEGGSACLRDVDRCEAIMRAVVGAVDCPVTMKMRLGWNETDLVYIEVAKRAQAVGRESGDAARAHGEAVLQR